MNILYYGFYNDRKGQTGCAICLASSHEEALEKFQKALTWKKTIFKVLNRWERFLENYYNTGNEQASDSTGNQYYFIYQEVDGLKFTSITAKDKCKAKKIFSQKNTAAEYMLITDCTEQDVIDYINRNKITYYFLICGEIQKITGLKHHEDAIINLIKKLFPDCKAKLFKNWQEANEAT